MNIIIKFVLYFNNMDNIGELFRRKERKNTNKKDSDQMSKSSGSQSQSQSQSGNKSGTKSGTKSSESSWRSDWTQPGNKSSQYTTTSYSKLNKPWEKNTSKSSSYNNNNRSNSRRRNWKKEEPSSEPRVIRASEGGWKPPTYDISTPEGKMENYGKLAQGHLNKMTEVTFERLSEKFLYIAHEDENVPGLLKLLIDKVFSQALRQPSFCHIYANLCQNMHQELTSFRRVLLNKCQEEFEKDDIAPNENLTDEEKSMFIYKNKKRTLGNIKFIGELYKNNVIVEPVIYECIKRLFKNQTPENPDDEHIESLCDLLVNIGKLLDTPRNEKRMTKYFQKLETIKEAKVISNRTKFMIEDLNDLRKKNWD